MTMKLKLCMLAGGVSVAALGATPAFAAGTTAGSTITNTATINYTVGGVAQTALTATNNFVVDRKIVVAVSEPGNTTTSVSPGQTVAVTTFLVTNSSNATLDLKLTAAQLAGGTAPHGGTDGFDVTGPTMYVDTDLNGVYTAGTDLAVTYLDEVAADASRTVFIVASVPISATNGQIAAVSLTAQAEVGGAAASEGAVILETTGANTAAMDTVFADVAGTDDAVRDGKGSARDDYTVAAPVLSVAKQSRIVSDPFNGTTNPKMIPGATVEYCIVVTNAAGSASANSVAISDPLPAQTTYDSAYGIFQSGTYTGSTPTGTCNLDGAAGGSFSAGTVNGSLGTLAAGTTRTIYFRVTIN